MKSILLTIISIVLLLTNPEMVFSAIENDTLNKEGKAFITPIIISLTDSDLNRNLFSIPVDANAGCETKMLFNNMLQLGENKKMLFGHQDDLAYGSSWRYNTANRGNLHESDTKDVVGDLPALFGWDIGQYYPDSLNYLINGVKNNDLKKLIISAYKNGGINTISWHCDNPLTKGMYNDCNRNTVHDILNDSAVHNTFIKWLSFVADFIDGLKVDGVSVPVIFRPFHESNLSGSFWWDSGSCNAEDYRKLWKMTVEYLRDTRQVHNILYAFSVNDGFTGKIFSNKFQKDYIDIIGFDIYQRINSASQMKIFISKTRNNCSEMATIAAQYGKVPAITEIGAENIPNAKWWSEAFLPAIKDMSIAYVLLWRNPYRRVDASASYSVSMENNSMEDFIDMYNNNPQIIFCKGAKALYFYR